MDIAFWISQNWYAYLLIPALIFTARVVDVSLGTIRVIFVSKGYRIWAPVLGFFEVLIWLMAIQQIMVNITNVFSYVAYAMGFAGGTYAGMLIEEKISVGKVVVRVVTKHDAKKLFKSLKDSSFSITSMGAKGPDGKVKLIMCIVRRHNVMKIINLVKKSVPDAFYSVEDVRFAFETHPYGKRRAVPNIFGYRKSK